MKIFRRPENIVMMRYARAACLLCLAESFSTGVFAHENGYYHQSFTRNSADSPPLSRVVSDTCSEIDSSLLIKVIVSRRQLAVAMLHRRSAILLTNGNLAKLLGITAIGKLPTQDIAGYFIHRELHRLEQKKRDAVERQVGDWTGAEDYRLEKLRTIVDSRESIYMPFLVMAEGMNEETGFLSANYCGSTLLISQSSLGTPNAARIKIPLVVFVRQKPDRVIINVALAQ